MSGDDHYHQRTWIACLTARQYRAPSIVFHNTEPVTDETEFFSCYTGENLLSPIALQQFYDTQRT